MGQVLGCLREGNRGRADASSLRSATRKSRLDNYRPDRRQFVSSNDVDEKMKKLRHCKVKPLISKKEFDAAIREMKRMAKARRKKEIEARIKAIG
jgi:biopolymer transport protein ExbB/TolQ